MSSLFLVGALGLLVGFLIGVTVRDAIDLLRSRKDRGMRLPGWLTGPRTTAVAVVFAVTANLAVLLVFVITHHSQNAFQRCEAQYQEHFAQGYRARYAISRSVSHAMDRIVRSVADHSAVELHTAVAHYQRLRTEQANTQATHPIPPLPSQVCGPLKDAG